MLVTSTEQSDFVACGRWLNSLITMISRSRRTHFYHSCETKTTLITKGYNQQPNSKMSVLTVKHFYTLNDHSEYFTLQFVPHSHPYRYFLAHLLSHIFILFYSHSCEEKLGLRFLSRDTSACRLIEP